MSALGQALRRLGVLAGIEYTQAEDDARAERHGGQVADLQAREAARAADVERLVRRSSRRVVG